MKILVTGAAGMLGSALVPEFRKLGHEVFATDIVADLPRLDVRNDDEVKASVADIRPDLIMHLAAETSLEVCDGDPAYAWETNTAAVGHVARAAAASDVPLVYISTAGVFDGEKDGAYQETDPPNPINVYGETKLAGEKLVAEVCDRYFIVRAGWMVGGGAIDHKFVGMIVRQLLDGMRTVYAVGDKLGSPTYTVDFARCLAALVATEDYGLYHMVCEGGGSRYEVAAEIIAHFGLAGEIELVKVGSEHFAERFSSRRPRSEVMVNSELERRGLNSMRPWQVAIKEYLDHNFSAAMAVAGSR